MHGGAAGPGPGEWRTSGPGDRIGSRLAGHATGRFRRAAAPSPHVITRTERRGSVRVELSRPVRWHPPGLVGRARSLAPAAPTRRGLTRHRYVDGMITG